MILDLKIGGKKVIQGFYKNTIGKYLENKKDYKTNKNQMKKETRKENIMAYNLRKFKFARVRFGINKCRNYEKICSGSQKVYEKGHKWN